MCRAFMLCKLYFSSSTVASCTFSALRSAFGHHPHALRYLCAPNFVSVAPSIAELVGGEKLRTQSLTQPLAQSLTHPTYFIPQEPKLSLWNTPYSYTVHRSKEMHCYRNHCRHIGPQQMPRLSWNLTSWWNEHFLIQNFKNVNFGQAAHGLWGSAGLKMTIHTHN